MAKRSKYVGITGIASDTRRRPQRVADVIRTEVALLLLGKIKDPRLTHISITQVSVTNDLRTARIFYSVLGDQSDEDIQKGLASAKGFIRSHLAHQLNLRYMPELQFKRDLTFEQQDRIEKLLQEIEGEHGDKSS